MDGGVGSNREMIDAFVSGQLSEADHDLMAHHIATCEQCAAAVAAERAVRGELAKLQVQDALPAPSPVVSSADLSVPPVPELQLDFVLDRTLEAAGLLLAREPVREVALDQLPPAPPHSERRAERGDVAAGVSVHAEGESPAGDNPRLAYADDTEVAAATAAGIADSVAHAAAELANTSSWESLEIGEDAEPAESAPATGAGSPAADEEVAVAAPDTVLEEFQASAGQETPAAEEADASLPIGETAAIDEGAPALVDDVAVEEESVRVGDEAETVALTVVRREAAPPKDRTRMWGVAAAVLVIGLASVYAAGQLRSGETGVATAGAGQLAQVAEADAGWGMTPSILVPILDSAVYDRVIDVPATADSIADSADRTAGAGPAASEGATLSASPAGTRPARSPRRPRPAERLPEIVSDPPEADDPPRRPPPGETLPEVMRGNAPSRTTTRGSAVVISGVPDVPRLLRTTTHRPRPDVAYVLREYDASAAEPVPRAGVNEYRWSDATGSRLFVLSGPVDAAELRAYARQLRTR